jgi:hypothetical protein
MNPLTEELLAAMKALGPVRRLEAATGAWYAAGCPDAPPTPTPNLPACEINGHVFKEGNVWCSGAKCMADREDVAQGPCPLVVVF